jgi:hypothetical protein
VYAVDMKYFALPHAANATRYGVMYYVRRRRWIRAAVLADLEAAQWEEPRRHLIAHVAAGCCVAVPGSFLDGGLTQWELSVRPCVDKFCVAWGTGFKLLGRKKKEWMQPSPLLVDRIQHAPQVRYGPPIGLLV